MLNNLPVKISFLDLEVVNSVSWGEHDSEYLVGQLAHDLHLQLHVVVVVADVVVADVFC